MLYHEDTGTHISLQLVRQSGNSQTLTIITHCWTEQLITTVHKLESQTK